VADGVIDGALFDALRLVREGDGEVLVGRGREGKLKDRARA